MKLNELKGENQKNSGLNSTKMAAHTAFSPNSDNDDDDNSNNNNNKK